MSLDHDARWLTAWSDACNLYDKQQDSRTLESNCKIKQQTNTLATVLGGQVLLPIKSSP